MKKILFFIFASCILVGCSNQTAQQNTELEQSIYSIVSDENSKEIDLNIVVNFEWESAYLFHPYTPQETMNEQLKFEFKDHSNIEMREDIYLLIFVNNGKVAQYAEISRQKADFISEKEVLTPSHSIISIER